MVYEGTISGRYVELRSATEEDAEFTLALRQDPVLGAFFPKLDITVEQQKQWIKKQETVPDSYFFCVWDKEGNRVGTISIYDIAGDVAESGRIAMRGNAFQSMEAQFLLFQFAFDELKLRNIVGYIFVENKRALRFIQQFGAELGKVKKDNSEHTVQEVFTSREAFYMCKSKLTAMLYRKR